MLIKRAPASPPNAVAETSTPQIAAGGTAKLDGSGSRDTDENGASIVEYTWNFDNQTTPENDSFSSEPSTFAFLDQVLTVPGEYLVTLTVKDDEGELSTPDGSTSHVTITVLEAANDPTAQITIAPVQCTGSAIILNASASHDNDSLGQLPIIRKFEWLILEQNTLDTVIHKITTQPILKEFINKPGHYKVGLFITDNDGQTDEVVEGIEVVNLALQAEPTEVVLCVGSKEKISVKLKPRSDVYKNVVVSQASADGRVQISKLQLDLSKGSDSFEVNGETPGTVIITINLTGTGCSEQVVVHVLEEGKVQIIPSVARAPINGEAMLRAVKCQNGKLKGLGQAEWNVQSPLEIVGKRTGESIKVRSSSITQMPADNVELNDPSTPESMDAASSVEIIGFDLLINNSTEATDDLVQLDNPFGRFPHITPCKIKLSGSLSDVPVILGSKDNKLGFPVRESGALRLMLHSDGNFSDFSIGGYKKSDQVGDSEVRVSLESDPSTIYHRVPATVFYLDGKLDRKIGEKYGTFFHIVAGVERIELTVKPPPAISFEGTAKLFPEGMDCDAPQIKDLKIGLLQNCISSFAETVWTNPEITWSREPVGSVPARLAFHALIDFNTEVLDSNNEFNPYIHLPSELRAPEGCDNSGPVMGRDTPNLDSDRFIFFSAHDDENNEVDLINYRLTQQAIKDEFLTWLVSVDSFGIAPSKEIKWTLDVATGKEKRAKASGSRTPTKKPITVEPFCNDYAKTVATEEFTGGAVTFTYPNTSPPR